ncbi:peptidoglycan recognition protein family protein [Paraclostridium sordellii]|uniref:peptidoglycan recognition protein family protein n=1 Tax=Paraclostridium sordellii TaxID=1505 RepID=UPI0005DBA137|nr:peptidoglycan recognition family protein [Paeniclostridium sordellii]CEP42583.1 N-acetylmuramoyl-L-alanine amidase family 2 protein [[Clostridium] sordellii] [Paeniclostridium sordellii]
MLDIKRKISPYNHYEGNNVEYIVIHYTGNINDTAKNNADYFYGGNRNASAHYFVDDNEIYQVVEEYNGAWHCGDGNNRYGINNRNSIAIEMCGTDNGRISEKTVENTLELTKHLMKKYGIEADHVVRHYDASRKDCPSAFHDNNWARWWDFKNGLSNNPTTKNINVIYQVYTKGRWLPNVTNTTDYAGIFGSPIQAIYANLNEGSIKYRVHTANGNWLPWVTNRGDYAGIYGKNIDGLQIQLIGLDDYSVEYSVYVEGRWLPWVIDLNDYAGIYGKNIEGVQIQVIKR